MRDWNIIFRNPFFCERLFEYMLDGECWDNLVENQLGKNKNYRIHIDDIIYIETHFMIHIKYFCIFIKAFKPQHSVFEVVFRKFLERMKCIRGTAYRKINDEINISTLLFSNKSNSFFTTDKIGLNKPQKSVAQRLILKSEWYHFQLLGGQYKKDWCYFYYKHQDVPPFHTNVFLPILYSYYKLIGLLPA